MRAHEFLQMSMDYCPEDLENKLKTTIAEMYGVSIGNVLLCNGATESISIALLALSERGSEVIVEFPFFKDFSVFLDNFNVSVKKWHLDCDNHFHIDIKSLYNLVNHKTSCLVVNHPHNPTGVMWNYEQLISTLKILEDNNAFLISDEVTLPLLGQIPDRFMCPPAITLSESAVSVSSLSKLYGLPGLRLGWIVGTNKIIEKCARFKDQLSLCNASLSALIGLRVLENRNNIMQESLSLVEQNIATMKKWAERNSWLSVNGFEYGFCCFPQYHLPICSREFCEKLMIEKSIFLVPGEVFGLENHFRLSLGIDPESLKQGLDGIDDFVRDKK